MPLVLGGVGALLLVLLLFAMNSGSDTDTTGSSEQPDQQQRQAPKPRKSTPLKQGAAQAGKTPGRPAPPLTTAMLQKANAIIDEAKALNNEGTRLRNAGDNRGARAKQSEAKRKMDEVLEYLEVPSLWHEEADLEGWAMPAEYVTLGNLYGRIATYLKRIRMGGGK